MILHYVTAKTEAIAAVHYPGNPHKPYKPIYYKALNFTVNASKDSFINQHLSCLLNQSSCFWKRWASRMSQSTGDTFQRWLWCRLIPTILDCWPINFEEVVKVLKSLSREKRMLVGNFVTVVRIILTAGATSAASERSLLLLRSIKTWLRFRVAQKRPNSLSMLYDRKSILDDILLLHVAN